MIKGDTCILKAQARADLKAVLDTQVTCNLKHDAGANAITDGIT